MDTADKKPVVQKRKAGSEENWKSTGQSIALPNFCKHCVFAEVNCWERLRDKLLSTLAALCGVFCWQDDAPPWLGSTLSLPASTSQGKHGGE